MIREARCFRCEGKVDGGFQRHLICYNCLTEKTKVQQEDLNNPILSDKQVIAQLNAENFKLSAGMCIVGDGITGGAGGNPVCPLQSELRNMTYDRDRWVEEAERWQSWLNGLKEKECVNLDCSNHVQEVLLEKEHLQTQLDACKAENNSFNNVMAIIHRDGGHYVAKHGHKKASEDAIKVISKLKDKLDELQYEAETNHAS